MKDVSFEARAGEVLGIAGVQGDGQTELIKACFGWSSRTPARSASAATTSQHGLLATLEDGIGYIPEDRSHDGYVGGFSVRENLMLDLYRSDDSPAALVSSRRHPANAEHRSRSSTSHRVGLDTGLVTVRRQPAEGRRRAGFSRP